MTYTAATSQDRRIKRTQTALRDAFAELVMSKPYDEISLNEIIEKADVARSTFYQHFKSKDDILNQSLYAPMSVIATSIQADANESAIKAVLSHFWDKRSFARIILSQPTFKQAKTSLTQCIGDLLTKTHKAHSPKPPHQISDETIAAMIAQAQLELISHWLTGKSSLALQHISVGLIQASQGMLHGLRR